MQYKFSKHARNMADCAYKCHFQQYFSKSMNVSCIGGGVLEENHRSVASIRQTSLHTVVSSTPLHVEELNVQL